MVFLGLGGGGGGGGIPIEMIDYILTNLQVMYNTKIGGVSQIDFPGLI